ncbi:MAG TPA: hypothetical protein VGF69_00795 [Thermoanaerobaculia bacterium]|jgi:hypothetical protein
MNEERVTALLREHDPAGGHELAVEEVLRIRTAALSTRSERRTPVVARLVFATLALILFAGAWAATRDHEPLPAARPQLQTQPQPPEKRQIHYTAPGGTRIIWSLDPEFQL